MIEKSLEKRLKENYYKKTIKVKNLKVTYDLYELFDSVKPIDDFMLVFEDYLKTSKNPNIVKLCGTERCLAVSDIFHVIDFHNKETWYYDIDSDMDYFNQIVSKYMIDGGYFSYYMEIILRCQDIPNLRAEIMKYVLINWEYIIAVYHLDLIYEFGVLYGKTSLKNSRIEEDALRRRILRKVAQYKTEEDFDSLEKTVLNNLANDLIDPSTRHDFFKNGEWRENESSRYVEAGAIADDKEFFDLDLPVNKKTIEAVINEKKFAKLDRALPHGKIVDSLADLAAQKLDCRRNYLVEVCRHFFYIIMRWSAEAQAFVGLLDNGKPVKSLSEIIDEIKKEEKLFLADDLSFLDRQRNKITKILSVEQDKMLLNSSLVRLVVSDLIKTQKINVLDNYFDTKVRRCKAKIITLLGQVQVIKINNDGTVSILISDMGEFEEKLKAYKMSCSDLVKPDAWNEYLRVMNCVDFDRKDELVRKVVDFIITNDEIDFVRVQLYCGETRGYVQGLMVWLISNEIVEDGAYYDSHKVLVKSLDEFDERVEMEAILRKAIEIAFKAHRKQVDKNNVPYILHPLAVASMVDDEELKVAAILHDVIEDSTITPEYLLLQGIPEETVEIVKLLTKSEEEDYEGYLKRIKQSPKALAVKKADLIHNTDASREGGLDVVRRAKYAKARQILGEG